jgi:hypothetical protein
MVDAACHIVSISRGGQLCDSSNGSTFVWDMQDGVAYARNILAEAMRLLAAGQTESQNARGEPVSLPRGSTAR